MPREVVTRTSYTSGEARLVVDSRYSDIEIVSPLFAFIKQQEALDLLAALKQWEEAQWT